MVQIVKVNVSQLIAPTPNVLQQTGAVVSQGATNLSASTYHYLTQASDLTSIINGAISVTSMTWSSTGGGTVSVTLSAAHGIPTSDVVQGSISGVTPAGYNGTFAVTSTGTTTFTYPLASNPGSVTTQGVFTLEDINELQTFVNSYFAQGNAIGIYVLELGDGTPAQGVSTLHTYINAPALRFYVYGLPSAWAAEPTAYALTKLYTANGAQQYFSLDLGTIENANYVNWLGIKSVLGWAQNPAVASITTECDNAMQMYQILSQIPGNVNKATPFAYRYVLAATPLAPNNSDYVTLTTSFINFVDTGAEGGISNTLVNGGCTMDGNDFAYWYAADWMQINQAEALAAAVIQGNNNPTNPLYYNQAGINTLQAVSNGVNAQAVAFGLANGNPQTTAVSFLTYTADNPSQYQEGIYNGLALTFTPQTGFKSITFNLVVSQLAPTG